MSAPNQTEKDVSHVLIKHLQLHPEDKEESIFVITLRDTMSEDGIDALSIFSYE